MNIKKIIFFILSVAISLIAAGYRWGDSAHSIGLIRAGGSEAKHPASLESGKNEYTLIATATVIPPYKGNAKVVLEGEPKMDYEIYLSEPVVDLKLHRKPELKDSVLYDLQPKDRIALWVLMKPPVVDPVCGMAYKKSFTRHTHDGKDLFFCSESCLETFRKEPDKYKDMGVRGKYMLAFYDTTTGKSVLNVPVIFKAKGDAHNAGEHH